jgi:hypothetical protein
MLRIKQAEPLAGYRVRLIFEDGAEGVADLSHLAGRGVFKRWEDENFFRDLRVDERGDLAWGEELDLSADALYLQITGKRPEDVFPSLRRTTSAHA